MRKEKSSLENIKSGNNFKKTIIKRINESARNINKKIETYRNKKVHLYLNNDSNSYYTRKIQNIGLFSHNHYNHSLIQNEKYNNFFLKTIFL